MEETLNTVQIKFDQLTKKFRLELNSLTGGPIKTVVLLSQDEVNAIGEDIKKAIEDFESSTLSENTAGLPS